MTYYIVHMMIMLWIFINIALKTTEKYPTWNHEKGYLSASLAFSQDCIQGQQVLSKSEKYLLSSRVFSVLYVECFSVSEYHKKR